MSGEPVVDPAGFTAFMQDAARGLQRTAWLLTGDWSSADDLVQAALVKTWQRWDHIDHRAAHGYVRRVMVTTFLGWRSRRWTSELALGWLPDRHDEHEAFDEIDLRSTLIAALRLLPRQQRAVVVLRYFDDLSEASTAEVLGCSVGTVKSHATRAMKALRAVPGLASLADERTVG
jgi:RNA polymerase sigma-70 factor (sigma-E family)